MDYEAVAERLHDIVAEVSVNEDRPDEVDRLVRDAKALLCRFMRDFCRQLEAAIAQTMAELRISEEYGAAELVNFVDSLDTLAFLRSEAALREFLDAARPILETTAGPRVDELIGDVVASYDGVVGQRLEPDALYDKAMIVQSHMCSPPDDPPGNPSTLPTPPSQPSGGGEGVVKTTMRYVGYVGTIVSLLGGLAKLHPAAPTTPAGVPTPAPLVVPQLRLLAILLASWLGADSRAMGYTRAPDRVRVPVTQESAMSIA